MKAQRLDTEAGTMLNKKSKAYPKATKEESLKN
jgi:hypothetical protein